LSDLFLIQYHNVELQFMTLVKHNNSLASLLKRVWSDE
jgi:hypothetical protein